MSLFRTVKPSPRSPFSSIRAYRSYEVPEVRIRARHNSVVPVYLFRAQKGPNIQLRTEVGGIENGRTRMDTVTVSQKDGLVHPMYSDIIEGSNGATLRKMSDATKDSILKFCVSRPDAVIYRVPEGTVIPMSLTLIHEFKSMYSLQTTVPVELYELSLRITEFFRSHCEVLTYQQFVDEYCDGKHDTTPDIRSKG